jgi:hypothetical protein
MIAAVVGVSQARGNALLQAGQPVPEPIKIQAMIDTGASGTCIDPSVLDQLNLTPTGSIQVNSPTTGTQPVVADQYDVSLVIFCGPGQIPLAHFTLPVLKSELLVAQGFHALIGRDVLRGCLLSYDGANGLFSLAY